MFQQKNVILKIRTH